MEAGRVALALGSLDRGDPGVAERRERGALSVVEEVAQRERGQGLPDLRGHIAHVGEHVELAGRRPGGGDEDRLPARVLADPVGAVPGAEAGLLPAAHRQLQRRVVELRVVDAGDACLDPARELLAALGVAGPDRCLQPVAAVVGERDRLLGVSDPHHRQGRAEGLVGHAAHRVIDAGDDRRLEEEAGAGVCGPLAAGDDRRAVLDRVLDVGLDQLDLRREDDRADVDAPRSAGRSLPQSLDLGAEPLDELVMHGVLDVDALDRDADLPGVVEAVGGGGVGGALEVGVGEDDHRVLAAELQRDRGERVGSLLHHRLAGLDRAREHHVVDKVDERGAGLAAAGGDAEDTVGQPGLSQHLGHQHRGERGDLRRLEDDRVAGRERRDAVAEGVVEREVPGADHADDADRRVADLEPAAAADEGRGRLDVLVGKVGGGVLRPELERADAVGELGELRLVGGAPGLRADRLDHPVAVGDHPGAGGHQHPGPLLEPGGGPARLRCARPLDHRGDVGCAELRDGRDRLPRGGVLDRDASSIAARAGLRAA